jgi:hypothetical protein
VDGSPNAQAMEGLADLYPFCHKIGSHLQALPFNKGRGHFIERYKGEDSAGRLLMNCTKNIDGSAARRAATCIELAKMESDCPLSNRCGAPRKANRPTWTVARLVAMSALLFSPCPQAQAGLFKPDVNYSNYEVPLWDQVVNRIKAKVSARLGQGENKVDRYFIVPFAYQHRDNYPARAHSFISVIRVFADNKQPRNTRGLRGLRRGEYRDRNFEAFTISWMPADFANNQDLCVFSGFGSRIDPDWNTCPIVPGKCFDLVETLKLAVLFKNAVGMWGPYEIKKEAFELGVKRKELLDGGTIRYKADDRLTRKDQAAINCFHAMAALEHPYPAGGFLDTGLLMWGIDGTARVLIEYTKAVRDRGLILEPVDIKKDLYGFVYAPERNAWGVYNPFRNASAYHDQVVQPENPGARKAF